MSSECNFSTPSQEQSRIGFAIAEYLVAVDSQQDFDVDAWLSRYSDVADLLSAFIADQVRVGRLIAQSTVNRSNEFNSKSATDHLMTSSDSTGEVGPRQFGAYELQRVIGRGGMGVVYAARHVQLKREVALKVLRFGSHSTPDDLRRFQLEAEAIARMDHPGIIPIYEVGQRDGLPYFTMKLITGGSLRDWLEQDHTTDTISVILQWVSRIASALHHAHQRGVLHRDLKPANILLDENRLPVVADFGLAKDFHANDTTTGRILGTPGFLAPEQISGESTIASDIYSLGVVMYTLLTKHPPFPCTTLGEYALKLQTTTTVPPRFLNYRIPADVETICLKCLRSEPSARYSSAAELQEDILAFLNDRPIRARPVSWLEATSKHIRRHWQTVLAYSMLAAVSLFAIAWAIVSHHLTSLEEIRQQRQLEVHGLASAIAVADLSQLDNLLNWDQEQDALISAALEEQWSSFGSNTDDWFDNQKVDHATRLNVAIALLPKHPEIASLLKLEFLKASPRESGVIGKQLARWVPAFLEGCRLDLNDEGLSVEQKLRIVAFLASPGYSSDRQPMVPEELIGPIVDLLTGLPPIEFTEWSEMLTPLLGELTADLWQVVRSERASQQKHIHATELLSRAWCDHPEKMFELLLHSKPTEFSLVWRRVGSVKSDVVELASTMLSKHINSANCSDDELESISRAAICVALAGAPELLLSSLSEIETPSLSAFLTRDLSAYGVPVSHLWNLAIDDDRKQARFGLLCCISSYPQSAWPQQLLPQARRTISDWVTTDPDPGVHSVAQLILSRWQCPLPDTELNSWNESNELNWFVNGQRQIYAIIDMGDLVMGSPSQEMGRDEDERLHQRFIGRKLAVAATEITIADFLRFRPDFLPVEEGNLVNRQRPLGGIDWYAAAEYCNWLSEQESIPRDQWCYEPNAQGEYAAGMRIAPDALLRTGYRLPTEAEWEYACRAGSKSSRYYGDSPELLPAYAWFNLTSHDRSHPTGQLLPNRFGLHDMLGNLYEWCHDVPEAYPDPNDDGTLGNCSDPLVVLLVTEDSQRRCIRGGSYDYSARHSRSAYRTHDMISDRISNNGLRPVRTLIN